MAISKVQNAVYINEADASVTASFPNTPTEGNLMIALGRGTTAYTNASISGWTLASSTQTASSGAGMGLWYKVAGVGESKDVTLNWTDSTETMMFIEEWTGLSAIPLDQIADVDNSGSVTSKSSGTTPTTTVADELCLAGFATSSTISAESWSNSFVLEKRNSSTPKFLLGSRIVASTGTYETTLSWTTARYAGGLIATFKGAVTSVWTPKVIMVM
jgi:hypothetical protein